MLERVQCALRADQITAIPSLAGVWRNVGIPRCVRPVLSTVVPPTAGDLHCQGTIRQRQALAKPSGAGHGNWTQKARAIRVQITGRLSKFWPAETITEYGPAKTSFKIQLLVVMRTRSALNQNLGLKKLEPLHGLSRSPEAT